MQRRVAGGSTDPVPDVGRFEPFAKYLLAEYPYEVKYYTYRLSVVLQYWVERAIFRELSTDLILR